MRGRIGLAALLLLNLPTRTAKHRQSRILGEAVRFGLRATAQEKFAAACGNDMPHVQAPFAEPRSSTHRKWRPAAARPSRIMQTEGEAYAAARAAFEVDAWDSPGNAGEKAVWALCLHRFQRRGKLSGTAVRCLGRAGRASRALGTGFWHAGGYPAARQSETVRVGIVEARGVRYTRAGSHESDKPRNPAEAGPTKDVALESAVLRLGRAAPLRLP